MDKHEANEQRIKVVLDMLLEKAYEVMYEADFRKTHSFEDMRNDVLGMVISKYVNWNGLEILEVAGSALEDSNFHPEAAIVRKLIETTERF